MDKAHMVKIDSEIDNMRVAAKFLKWTFDNVVNEIEDIVEVEKKIKHSQISNKVEKMLEREDTIKKFLAQFEPSTRPDSSLFEYPLGILIQSGKLFTPNKLNVQCDQNVLTAETIYVNTCAKYRDMNIMASRTFLVNPDDTQKQTYNLVNEALDAAIKALVPGQPVKSAYVAGRDHIKAKDATLAGKIHTTFGFGVSIFRIVLIINRSEVVSRRISSCSTRPTRT